MFRANGAFAVSQPSLSNNYRIRRNARGSLNTQPSVRDRELPRKFSIADYLRVSLQLCIYETVFKHSGTNRRFCLSSTLQTVVGSLSEMSESKSIYDRPMNLTHGRQLRQLGLD